MAQAMREGFVLLWLRVHVLLVFFFGFLSHGKGENR